MYEVKYARDGIEDLRLFKNKEEFEDWKIAMAMISMSFIVLEEGYI